MFVGKLSICVFQASGAGTVSNDFLELLLFGTPR